MKQINLYEIPRVNVCVIPRVRGLKSQLSRDDSIYLSVPSRNHHCPFPGAKLLRCRSRAHLRLIERANY